MLRFVFFVAVVFTASSCMVPLGFQTAKTLEKDEILLMATADINATASIEPGEGFADFRALSYQMTSSLNLAFRSGMRVENMDWGLYFGYYNYASSSLSMGADVKYQFAGDRESVFAAATGLSLGWVPWLWSFDNYPLDGKSMLVATVPLFLTLDFNDKASFTFTPNYRYGRNSFYSFHAAVFNLSMRFRVKNTENLRSYYSLDLHVGRSFAGPEGYNNLLFGAIGISAQHISRILSEEERLKRKRKKQPHKVFFEY